MYTYKIYSSHSSSDRLGKCEVCGNSVSEVFHQVEKRKYQYGEREGETLNNCYDYFGHEECLKSKRR